MRPSKIVFDEWNPKDWSRANFQIQNVDLAKNIQPLSEALSQASKAFSWRMSGSFALMRKAIEDQRRAYEWNLRLNELRKFIPCSKGKAPFYIEWAAGLDCKQCKDLDSVYVSLEHVHCLTCNWSRPRDIKGYKPERPPVFLSVKGPELDIYKALQEYIAASRRK